MKLTRTIVIISLLFINIASIKGAEKTNVKKESQRILNSKVLWAAMGMVVGSVGTNVWWKWQISDNQVKKCLSVVKTFEELLQPNLGNHIYGYEIKAHIANKPSVITRGELSVPDCWKDWVKLNRNGDHICVTIKWKLDAVGKARSKIVLLWQSYQEQFNVQWTGEQTPK